MYIASMPFLHALSPLPIIALNAFFLVAAAPFVMAIKTPKNFQFSISNFFTLGIFIYGLLIWFFSPLDTQQDRWQSALQWSFSIFGLFIIVRRWIVVSQIKIETISKICFFSAIFLGISSVTEFILANSIGLFFSDILYFSIDNFTDANVFRSDIMRPRVFSAEAGFTSMVFELLIPMSIVHLLTSTFILRALFVITCFLGVIVLFSTASILSAIVAILILNSLNKDSILIKITLFFSVTMFFLYSISGLEFSDLPFYKITDFFDSQNYSQSEGSRQETIAAGMKLITENPLGIGWGTVLQESKIYGTEIDRMILGSGLISLWLELAVAIGPLVSLIPIYYVCKTLSQLYKIKSLPANCCFISLCSLALHHLAVFEVWFPMFWFALALSKVLISQNVAPKKQNSHPMLY